MHKRYGLLAYLCLGVYGDTKSFSIFLSYRVQQKKLWTLMFSPPEAGYTGTTELSEGPGSLLALISL